MAPYYGPDEDPATIFLEKSFLAGDFVSGVGYGIQILLYGASARCLWRTKEIHRRHSYFLLAYITTLLCIETIFQITQSRTVELVYVDNRNYPGGPWAYFLATQNLPINVAFIATLFSVTFLADLLVYWRCWVIWSAFGNVSASIAMILPTLLLLASFVMGILWTLQSSQPGLSLYAGLPVAYGTTYYAISLSVNVILTVLIIVRLFLYRRTLIASLPEEHAEEYVSIATIMVESASIYSVFALIFLITYAVNNPINSVFLAVASSSQQIANYMIIIRLSRGRAWGLDDTYVPKTGTQMDFVNEQSRSLGGPLPPTSTIATDVNEDDRSSHRRGAVHDSEKVFTEDLGGLRPSI